MDSPIGMKLLSEHMLLGWLADKPECINSHIYQDAKRENKRQWHLNYTYQSLLEELAPQFKKIHVSPIILKGLSLLEDYYSDIGSRSMSDIDLLINPRDLSRTIDILTKNGFKVISEQKWKANNHKVELNKISNGIELVIELHTCLFYHCEDPVWETSPFSTFPFLKLAPDHNLLYLCTHLGFQHSFLKLFWFLDIHLLISSCDNIDEEKIIEMAKKHQVYNSLLFSLSALKSEFKTPLGETFLKEMERFSSFKKSLLNRKFIIDPKKNYLKYLSIKHLCKDSLKESLSYDLGWFKDRFFS